jgi:ribosome-associated protein
MKTNDVKKQVALVLAAAEAKKAEDVKVLQLPKESSAFTDYFIVCSGSNPRQVQAIADEVDERLSKEGFEPNHREGYDHGEWILLDYVDFVVHIFNENARKFYDLERLWKSASKLTPGEILGKKKSANAAAKAKATPKTKRVVKKPARKLAAKAVRKVAAKRPTAKARSKKR